MNLCSIKVKNRSTNNGKIPSSLLYFFLISQLGFGINFGFTECLKEKLRTSVKFSTLTLSIIYIIILICPNWNTHNDIWFWFGFFQYTVYFIVLNNTKYTLYNFLMDTKNMIDVRTKDKIVINAMTNIQTVSILAFKITLMIANCNYGGNDSNCRKYHIVYYIFYCIPHLALDIIIVGQVTIFYYLQLCVRDLKEGIHNGISCKMILKRYKEIADLYDKIRPLSDNLIILEICVGIPKVTANFWFLLYYMKVNKQLQTFVTQLTFAIHVAIQVLFPAIFSEMVNSQMDEIKLLLNEQLVCDIDERKSSEIQKILRYLKARRLQHAVWRFIPTDIRLALSLSNLCVTYFIVLVQFTHIYE